MSDQSAGHPPATNPEPKRRPYRDSGSAPADPAKPKFQDITLYDKETGEPFIFTAKEQEFFAKQGFTHVPAHSPERRKQLREQRYKGKPIFNVKCVQCGKVGKITQEPPDPKHIYCEFCFAEKWNAHLEKHPELQELHQPVIPGQTLALPKAPGL